MITKNKISDYDILKNDFYDLINLYEIKINIDYQFIYDEFFEHLIFDVYESVAKNFKEGKNSTTLLDYKKAVFRNFFYKHLSSDWFYKIKKPESVISLRKIVRKNKLKNILNEHK